MQIYYNISIFIRILCYENNSLYFIYGHTGRMGQPISLLSDLIAFSSFKPGLQLSTWAYCGALLSSVLVQYVHLSL